MNRIYISDASFLTDESIHPAYLERLPESRIKRYNEYKTKKQKALTLAASLLLEHKKEEEFFSISHSFPYAVCSFSDKKTGVDIEKIKNFNSSVVRRFFTEKEKLYIESFGTKEEKNEAFFILWTLKESAAKLYDTPLIQALQEYEFIPDGNFFKKDKLYCSVFHKDGFILSALSESGYFSVM